MNASVIRNAFPGYSYFKDAKGAMHNFYRGVELGYGGYVYSDPGIYSNVALLDVQSLHPHSAKELNVWGDYTKVANDILDARLAIKHHNYETAKNVLNGAFAPFLNSDEDADRLQKALKIIINSLYGYSSAKFPNQFRGSRNINNIVALRGALFIKTVQDEVEKRGFHVVHVKTDSIKIPNATKEIINYCCDFAHKYGYDFDHEATFEKFCLVNDSVYVCKVKEGKEHGAGPGQWSATGTQFQVPYVFKTLFSHEPIIFDDMCETKTVKSAMYLDFEKTSGSGDVQHTKKFVGKVGRFCPMQKDCGAGRLLRSDDGKKFAAVTGTSGYLWMESGIVKQLGLENKIDKSYYQTLVDNALATINQYGDAQEFIE